MDSVTEYRLTTIDNPYDPFEDFTEWLLYDNEAGHNCCGIVERLAKTSKTFSEDEVTNATNDAINEFIEADPTGLYIKLAKGDFEKLRPEFQNIYQQLSNDLPD